MIFANLADDPLLLKHLRTYALADFLGVPALQALSAEKFKNQLKAEKPSASQLSKAILEACKVITTTDTHGVHVALVETVAVRDDLLNDDKFVESLDTNLDGFIRRVFSELQRGASACNPICNECGLSGIMHFCDNCQTPTVVEVDNCDDCLTCEVKDTVMHRCPRCYQYR